MRRLIALALLSLLLAVTGCAKLMGGLRPDFDNRESTAGPTVGGSWSERGMLSDEDDVADGSSYQVGHGERGPASEQGYSRYPDRTSWITRDNADANARDRSRGDGQDEDAQNFSARSAIEPASKRLYKHGNRATRSDFVDEAASEGSLWASDGQTNYYFTKNKIRSVGDIISISMDDAFVRDLGVEIKRTLNEQEHDLELQLAQSRLDGKAAGDGKKDSATSSAAAPQRAPAADGKEEKPAASSTSATEADIDVAKSLEVKSGDLMMAEIIERYPNGNYKVRATKKVNYKAGASRLVTLVGIAKGSDIGEDDTVASGKLYEYRLKAIR